MQLSGLDAAAELVQSCSRGTPPYCAAERPEQTGLETAKVNVNGMAVCHGVEAPLRCKCSQPLYIPIRLAVNAPVSAGLKRHVLQMPVAIGQRMPLLLH